MTNLPPQNYIVNEREKLPRLYFALKIELIFLINCV